MPIFSALFANFLANQVVSCAPDVQHVASSSLLNSPFFFAQFFALFFLFSPSIFAGKRAKNGVWMRDWDEINSDGNKNWHTVYSRGDFHRTTKKRNKHVEPTLRGAQSRPFLAPKQVKKTWGCRVFVPGYGWIFFFGTKASCYHDKCACQRRSPGNYWNARNYYLSSGVLNTPPSRFGHIFLSSQYTTPALCHHQLHFFFCCWLIL